MAMEAENKSLFKKIKHSFLFTCFSSSPKNSSDYETKGDGYILQNVHAYSYSELDFATNGFRLSNKIGEGGFGSVYKGKLHGKLVAVKVLSAESKQGDKEFLSEIASLSSISHENLVQLHGACINGTSRLLVYEFLENSNLSQFLLGGNKHKAKKFSWKARREIALGIGEGIAYIHEEIKPHIVHRDIKASNILLDHNFAPKVSDFGLSKLFSDNVTHISTTVAGTLGYLAPEYAISGHLSRKSDIYSFGVLLLEIISGRTAIDFDLQLGEHYLVEKAWEMYKANKLLQLVDPMLNGDFIEEEAVRYIKVGLLCVQEKCRLRPKLSKAMKMMRNEIEISNIQITQPGLITDIMNVKIRQSKNSSQSISSNGSP